MKRSIALAAGLVAAFTLAESVDANQGIEWSSPGWYVEAYFLNPAVRAALLAGPYSENGCWDARREWDPEGDGWTDSDGVRYNVLCVYEAQAPQ